jgi:glutamine cyclotransferase
MKHTQAVITHEFGPFPQVDCVHGVSHDGALVWFASGNRLNALNPENETITRTLPIAADAGTAFDGTFIYQIVGAAIQKIEPDTGAIVATIPAPEGQENSGLAWADGLLWVGGGRGRTICQVDPATGAVVGRLRSDRFVTGITWVNDELWHGTWQDDTSDIRRIDPDTGTPLECLEMPPGTGVSGLEKDADGQFLCGGGPDGKIRRVCRA